MLPSRRCPFLFKSTPVTATPANNKVKHIEGVHRLLCRQSSQFKHVLTSQEVFTASHLILNM